MDKSQADAISRAVLEPDPKVQEELHRKRALEAQWLADRRQAAVFVLVGFAIGAAVAYFTGERFTAGGLWGGIAGGAVGWALVWWRKRGGAA